jgi:hypothetical protein
MSGDDQTRPVEQRTPMPAVERIGKPVRMAAMLAGLGLRHSRKRWPKSNARPDV